MTEQEQKIVDKVHDYEFEMMCKLDEVCRRHNITYYLEGGTLIGAARHKDFVPWDDDIDIYIKRKDFEKLCKYEDELKPYFIHIPNPDEKCFWDFTSRIMYDRVLFKKNDAEAKFYKHIHCQYLFFDFFIMDNYPGGWRGKLQIIELKLLYGLATSRRYKFNYNKKEKSLNALALSVLGHIGVLVPFSWIFKRYDKVSRRYNRTKGCKEFLLTNSAATFLSDCIYKKKWYKTRAELPIRGKNFFVPGEYDESLRNYYGDYMQLPPEEMRHPDHVRFDEIKFLNEK